MNKSFFVFIMEGELALPEVAYFDTPRPFLKGTCLYLSKLTFSFNIKIP